MAYRYAMLDVFTDRPLSGNALAVVPDAAGLDDARMQSIAAEFNLSETVFVLPADNPVHSARLRIFTPRAELPFAGHPTVGTAVYLAIGKFAGAGQGRHEGVLVLEEKVGRVRCGVFVTGGPSGHAVFDLPRLPEAVAAPLDTDLLAAAFRLTRAEIGFENHRPSAYSAGLPYAFIPVRDLSVMARLHPDPVRLANAFGNTPLAAYVYCRQTEVAGRQFHARMFAPDIGLVEDPATGSAAAAFAGVIQRFDQPPAGSYRYVIEQGFEMGRPSLIHLEVDVEAGAIAAARIGGDAVVIAEGTLDV
ncbi:MAG TPA: PhzF family phenazine biosynthesis protein [Bauldia sp.]|nr:PhzF family phenazine biosynthesis protein [Bauldia sp.]